MYESSLLKVFWHSLNSHSPPILIGVCAEKLPIQILLDSRTHFILFMGYERFIFNMGMIVSAYLAKLTSGLRQ